MGVKERYRQRKKNGQSGGSGGVRERYQARRRKQQAEEWEKKKPTAAQEALRSGVKNYFTNKRAEEAATVDAGEGFAASVGTDYSAPSLRRQQVAAAHNKFTGGYTEAEIAEMKARAQAAEKAGEAQPWYKGFFQKSSGNVAATILGTGLDAATAAGKGVLSLGEGLLDLGGYGLAGALDLFGADKAAEKIRKEAQKNVVEEGTKEATDFLDEYSVLGDTSKGVFQAAGQMMGIGAVGMGGELLGLGAKGVSALTTGTIGLSGAGSGMSEAYQGGATHGEALAYGLMSGSAEAVSELIFGGMGKGINALGFNKGLSSADDMLAKAVAKKFKSQFAKNLAEFGIKAGAEGAEEVIAGTAQALAKKLTYLSEEDLGQILADESLMEQFVIGSIVSGMAQTGGLVRSTAAGVDFISEDVQKAPIAPEAAPQGEGTRGVVGAAPYGAEGKTVPIAPPVTQNDEHGGSYEGKAGKDISDGNGRRDAGTGAGEQAGGLAAGTTERTNRTDRAREAAQIQTTAKGLRLESISSRELGIAAGTDARTVRVLPQGSWTEELKSLGKKVYDETGCQVTFTVGKMEIQGADGAMSAVRGVYEAGRIIVQADNLGVSPEQIADHEIYHAKRDFAGQILNEEIRVHILESYTREEYDAVLDRYIAGLRGVVDLDSAIDDAGFEQLMQQVEEELFADAYAGINAFQGNAAKFTGAVRERMEQLGMPRTEVPIAPPVPEKARRPRDVPIAPPVPNSQASGNEGGGQKFSIAPDVPGGMTADEVADIQSAEYKSLNEFTSGDIQKTQQLAKRYWKDMGIKSPFFRAWFGDWRAYDQTPVRVADQQGQQRGKQRNADTGWDIQISGKVFNETRMHTAPYNINARSYLPFINDIVQKAVLLDSFTMKAGKTKSANSLMMHSLYAVADIGNGPELLKLYVEEMNEPNSRSTVKRAYQLQNIESQRSGVQGSSQSSSPITQTADTQSVTDFYAAVKSGDTATGAGQLRNTENQQFDAKGSSVTSSPVIQTADIESVADLFAAVKSRDGNFKPKRVNPVLLNEDGTPRVFYHGSGETFHVFNPDEMAPQEGSYFFAENREDAAAYGDHVYEVYLTGENLADYDNQPSEFYRLRNKRSQVQWLKERGYDGWYADMDSGGWGEVSVFDNTQIKAAGGNVGTFDKGNPDIRYSLDEEKQVPIAPPVEVTDEVEELEGRISELEEEMAELNREEDYERYYRLSDERSTLRTQLREARKKNPVKLTKRLATDMARNMRGSLGLFNKEMATARSIIERYRTGQIADRAELREEISAKLGTFTEKNRDELVAEVKKTLRSTPTMVSEEIKHGIADYNDVRKRAFGRLRLGNDGLAVDEFYHELNTEYPGFFPDSIWSPEDQLRRMIEVAGWDAETAETMERSKEAVDEAANRLADAMEAARQARRDSPFAERIAELERDLADQNTFVSKRAKVLYDEIRDIKKGTRASDDLGYLLDHVGGDIGWRTIRIALLNTANQPGSIVDKNNPMEPVVRRMLQEQFDHAGQELRDLMDQEDALLSNPSFQRASQRRKKADELTEKVKAFTKNAAYWVDKKLGLGYQTSTLRRNLWSVVRGPDGKPDIQMADAIFEWLQGSYGHNEALLKRESRRIKQPYAQMNITKQEDVYIQMLGEFLHNPDSTVTKELLDDFYETNKGKIDQKKCEQVIEMARKTYDDLFARVNAVLKEWGMKEIQYRKGYFPHFVEPKQNWLQKLLNWKPQNNEIPTSIAGLTEEFRPKKSWQSFDKHRSGDVTDYAFTKGLDTYLHGALDWIYHIEDIQRRRSFENYLRYIHSDEGIRERIQELQKNNEYDADELQEQIDLVYKDAQNPLGNFVTDLRTGTNTLAGKKSTLDRTVEAMFNRKVYSTVTNIFGRVSANQVAGCISSALTNFIPITQSWGVVKPQSSLKAMEQTICSYIHDDGVVAKSDFLTNRLAGEEALSQSTWDKISQKATMLMEGIDNFTSQTVWRSKYLENISAGMSENEAIRNADRFAEGLMAGRSRGDMPTIFNSKNPFIKMATVFQLEVANQYGYLLQDMPIEAKNNRVAKLAGGYAKVFIGAYLYNALYSSLTGRTAALDPIRMIQELLRDLLDDEEDESAEDSRKRIGKSILNFSEDALQEAPFIGGLLGGGRISIASAFPYGESPWEVVEGTINDIVEFSPESLASLTKEWLNPVFYLAMPLGGGQLKKTWEGLKMYDPNKPMAGSYTTGGDLRFPVKEDFLSMAQAAVFGPWASEEAQEYLDEGWAPLDETRTAEFIASGLEIGEYREYKKALTAIKSDTDKNGDTISGSRKKKVKAYLEGLDISYGAKLILYKSQYKGDSSLDKAIVEYLNDRDDLDADTIAHILEFLEIETG